jgi:hypothetical protein
VPAAEERDQQMLDLCPLADDHRLDVGDDALDELSDRGADGAGCHDGCALLRSGIPAGGGHGGQLGYNTR